MVDEIIEEEENSLKEEICGIGEDKEIYEMYRNY